MNTPTKTINEPTESSTPCAVCHSPTFWRSAYGGSLRCAVCDPWPSLAMVGERWTIVLWRHGTLAWMPCLRRGERARDIEPQTNSHGVGNGVRSQVIEDADGTWLAIWKVKT
jgi:hypothetical protein